jgi:5-methylcytosine-specific restriction endonuclease McrA
MNKRYLKFKKAGLCRRCGNPPLPGKTRCEKCHKSHLSYQNKNKKRLIEQGFCRSCGIRKKLPDKSTCQVCLDNNKKKEKLRYSLLRSEVIKEYGGHCTCCGKDNSKYLQLDHINNDGKEHRLELSGAQKGGMYAWAKRNNFPAILQLLCADCHQAKTSHGGCTIWDHPPYNIVYSQEDIKNLCKIHEFYIFSKEHDIQLNPYGVKYELFNDISQNNVVFINQKKFEHPTVEDMIYRHKKDLYSVLFCDFKDIPLNINGPLKEISNWRLAHGK